MGLFTMLGQRMLGDPSWSQPGAVSAKEMMQRLAGIKQLPNIPEQWDPSWRGAAPLQSGPPQQPGFLDYLLTGPNGYNRKMALYRGAGQSSLQGPY